MTWLIDLSKAGTNPDQAPRASISAPVDPREEGIIIGDIFHVAGQPEDVKWKVENIRELRFAKRTGKWMNGR